MIPKIIHYVWVGPKPLPEADRRRVEAWRRLLPDWEIRAWGNDQVDFSSSYLRQAYAVRAWNRVSDFLRMDVLARHGGVYLDTDVELVRRLDPLLDCDAFLGFQRGDDLPSEMVNGAVFGARPGHWLPSELRHHFEQRLDGRKDIGSFSGPGLITQALREHGLGGYSDEPMELDGVRLFPRRYFYPYSWTETYSEAVLTPDTYAVHHWADTWQVPPILRNRIRRKSLYLLSRCAPGLALSLSRAVAGRGVRNPLGRS